MPSRKNLLFYIQFLTQDSTSLKERYKWSGANEPSADNAGGFRRLEFTKPAKDEVKEKKQQVKPALRLPAGR